jgi:hypothetical protein
LDDVSFLPAAPTTGFSGVAGSGEPASGTPSQSGETVLTVNTQSISNFGTVNFNRMISHALSFNVGGGSFFLSFPGSDGYSMNGFTANGGVTQRLGARSSLIGGYSYSRTDFTQSGFILETNGVTVGFQRHWNGKFATTASVGPQWTTSSDPTTVPSTSSYSISASASYKLRAGSISAVYRRGVSSGGGFLLGAEVDSVSANYSRNFGRAWSTGIVGSYNRTAGLSNNGVLSAKFGSAQVNRRINRNISAFLSYTAIDQSSSASVPSNVLTSLTNEISIGIGWTPLETRLRH